MHWSWTDAKEPLRLSAANKFKAHADALQNLKTGHDLLEGAKWILLQLNARYKFWSAPSLQTTGLALHVGQMHACYQMSAGSPDEYACITDLFKRLILPLPPPLPIPLTLSLTPTPGKLILA